MYNLTKNSVQYSDEDISEITKIKEARDPKNPSPLSMGGTTVDNSAVLVEEKKEEHLALRPDEVQLMQEISEIIGNNPRAIKRFINVYQIVRAHEGLTIKEKIEDAEFARIMFLLALPLGRFKVIYKDFIHYIELYVNKEGTLDSFLQTSHEINSYSKEENELLNQLKNDLYVCLSDTRASRLLLSTTTRTLIEHNRFIQRFTFTDIK